MSETDIWNSEVREINGKKYWFINNKPCPIGAYDRQYEGIRFQKTPNNTAIIQIKKSQNAKLLEPTGYLYCINTNPDIVWEFNKDNYLNLKYGFDYYYQVDSKTGEFSYSNGDQLWLINYQGRHFRVDPETGKVLETKWQDFPYEIEKINDELFLKTKHISLKVVQQPYIGIFPFHETLVVKSDENGFTDIVLIDLDGKPIMRFSEKHKDHPYMMEVLHTDSIKPKYGLIDILFTNFPKSIKKPFLFFEGGCSAYIIDPANGNIIYEAPWWKN
jgi:hypothetical protein